MASVNITIPDAKLDRVLDAFEGFYRIPADENGDPQFTRAQWAKERVRRFIRDTVHRYEVNVARNTASSGVSPDDSIAS